MEILKRALGNLVSAPPIKESVQEAASQQLNKQVKLETAHQKAMADSLRLLDQQERNNVQRYMDQKVFNGETSRIPQSDSVVCDDMNFTFEQPRGVDIGKLLLVGLVFVGGAALTTLLLVAIGAGAWFLLGRQKPTPVPVTPPAAVNVDDSEYEVIFWQRMPDGSMKKIDVPRVNTPDE
jgi:hypothetical protein